ncbi:disulfide bond formation protein B [Denitratisoma sp. DHT3]|uniref:disulfide bond formation protein B n=1 Tax=Denitratisoma sp. DHT3 TaxID=1981880 RepID=UPI0016464F38|nr:disulfide bond formation protein B [Denitratisoma sp. DHT3]
MTYSYPSYRHPVFLLLGILALGFFFAGVLAGNLLHLAACPLCILQRMLYLMLGLAALSAWVGARSAAAQRCAALALTLVALGGSYVAGYQSYIQRIPDTAGCTAGSPWWEELVYWAGEKVPALFLSSGLCTDPGFKLLGLSLAEYSLMAFAAMAALGLLVFFRSFKKNS